MRGSLNVKYVFVGTNDAGLQGVGVCPQQEGLENKKKKFADKKTHTRDDGGTKKCLN